MLKVKKQTEDSGDVQKAYEYAVYLLSLSMRTEQGLTDKLLGKGFTKQAADDAVSRLKGEGYLDDERYAEAVVDSLKRYRAYGYYYIKKKLLERRVPEAVAVTVLERDFPPEDELASLERYLRKYGTAMPRGKLAVRLRARGFRSGAIARALFRAS